MKDILIVFLLAFSWLFIYFIFKYSKSIIGFVYYELLFFLLIIIPSKYYKISYLTSDIIEEKVINENIESLTEKNDKLIKMFGKYHSKVYEIHGNLVIERLIFPADYRAETRHKVYKKYYGLQNYYNSLLMALSDKQEDKEIGLLNLANVEYPYIDKETKRILLEKLKTEKESA